MTILHGPEIAAGEPAAERADPDFRDVVLERRLRQALPAQSRPAARGPRGRIAQADHVDGQASLVTRNRDCMRMLVDGVNVEYHPPGRFIGGCRRSASWISRIRTTTTGWR